MHIHKIIDFRLIKLILLNGLYAEYNIKYIHVLILFRNLISFNEIRSMAEYLTILYNIYSEVNGLDF